MTNFIETFKNKAKNKTLTSADMIAHRIYKTVKAKSENKEVILNALIKKAFTAGAMNGSRTHPYQAVDISVSNLVKLVFERKRWDSEVNKFVMKPGTLLDQDITKILSEDEISSFNELISHISSKRFS